MYALYSSNDKQGHDRQEKSGLHWNGVLLMESGVETQLKDAIYEIGRRLERIERDQDRIHERLDRLEGLRQLFTAIEELQRYVADMDNQPVGMAFTMLR